MALTEGTCWDAFFELRNVSECDERGSKSEKAEVAIV